MGVGGGRLEGLGRNPPPPFVQVVRKQRVDRWNNAHINSDHWGPRNWHLRFENIGHCGFTGSEMKPLLVKLQPIAFHKLLDMLLLLALCITLCWRFGCRFWGGFWDSNMRGDAGNIHQIFGQMSLIVENMTKTPNASVQFCPHNVHNLIILALFARAGADSPNVTNATWAN